MALTSDKGHRPPPHVQRCLVLLDLLERGLTVQQIAASEGYKEATVRRMLSTAHHWRGYSIK